MPAFHLMLRTPIKVAVGSSLACFMINALISAAFKGSQGHVAVSLAIPLCLGTTAGSVCGAQLNRLFTPTRLKVTFGVLFAIIAVKFVLAGWGGKP